MKKKCKLHKKKQIKKIRKKKGCCPSLSQILKQGLENLAYSKTWGFPRFEPTRELGIGFLAL
jgi:hypothetical protein